MRISDWSSDVCSSDLALICVSHRVPALSHRASACNGRVILQPAAAMGIWGAVALPKGWSMSSRELAVELQQGLRDKAARYFAQCGIFFRGFLEHPRMVGSIIPSSRFTVRRMLAPVDWRKCRVFVEYGPGIGTFCRPGLERMSGDATPSVIDTNPLFIDHLRSTIRDKRFHAVLGSAEDRSEEHTSELQSLMR